MVVVVVLLLEECAVGDDGMHLILSELYTIWKVYTDCASAVFCIAKHKFLMLLPLLRHPLFSCCALSCICV